MKTVKWGVLGVADHFVKKVFLPARDSDAVDVVAIASRRKESAQAAAAKLGIPRAYGSYEDLLADKEVEA